MASMHVTEVKQQLLGMQKECQALFPAAFPENRSETALADPIVLVMGEVNCGKSTLVNTLLGKKVAPVSKSACTSKITRIRACKAGEPQGYVCGEKRGKLAVDDTNIDKTLKEVVVCAERDKAQAMHVDVCLTGCTLLDQGAWLVDSPGLGENREMTQLVLSYVGKAKAILYCLSAPNNCLREVDKSSLEKIMDALSSSSNQISITFIVTKMDMVGANDDDESDDEASVKDNLKKEITNFSPELEGANIETYFLSAKKEPDSPEFDTFRNHVRSVLENALQVAIVNPSRQSLHHLKTIFQAEEHASAQSQFISVVERNLRSFQKDINNQHNQCMQFLAEKIAEFFENIEDNRNLQAMKFYATSETLAKSSRRSVEDIYREQLRSSVFKTLTKSIAPTITEMDQALRAAISDFSRVARLGGRAEAAQAGLDSSTTILWDQMTSMLIQRHSAPPTTEVFFSFLRLIKQFLRLWTTHNDPGSPVWIREELIAIKKSIKADEVAKEIWQGFVARTDKFIEFANNYVKETRELLQMRQTISPARLDEARQVFLRFSGLLNTILPRPPGIFGMRCFREHIPRLSSNPKLFALFTEKDQIVLRDGESRAVRWFVLDTCDREQQSLILFLECPNFSPPISEFFPIDSVAVPLKVTPCATLAAALERVPQRLVSEPSHDPAC
eukprot:c19137_g1_i3.p1 GENE.c19137_g1_i3~~c19137_g1_i3.p1  ORF type:complete len:673 (+),score=107.03 c19137_g1_i3:1508-3526(+)